MLHKAMLLLIRNFRVSTSKCHVRHEHGTCKSRVRKLSRES